MHLLRIAIALTTGVTLSLVSLPVAAQTAFYPLSTRSFFLTGCVSDDPPNYNNPDEFYLKMRACVCLLDKFQAEYSHEQFIALFEGVEAERQPQEQEAERFVMRHIHDCL